MSRQWESCALTSHAAIADDEDDEPHTAAGPFLHELAARSAARQLSSRRASSLTGRELAGGSEPMNRREISRYQVHGKDVPQWPQ